METNVVKARWKQPNYLLTKSAERLLKLYFTNPDSFNAKRKQAVIIDAGVTTGFIRSESRVSFPPFSSHHSAADIQKRTDALKLRSMKWRWRDCPLRLLHYLFLCVHFLFSVLMLPLCGWCFLTAFLQVCTSISCPPCPVSCHPFTRPSSLCHHQGPGRDKGLYLGNAPSNRSS